MYGRIWILFVVFENLLCWLEGAFVSHKGPKAHNSSSNSLVAQVALKTRVLHHCRVYVLRDLKDNKCRKTKKKALRGRPGPFDLTFIYRIKTFPMVLDVFEAFSLGLAGVSSPIGRDLAV